MQESKIILLSLLLFVSTIFAKNCKCGSNCQHFKGKVVNDKCYYVAFKSSVNGVQFLVSNGEEENLVIKTIFNGLTTSPNVQLGTRNSYSLRKFKSSCLDPKCTKTVYRSMCHCTLNTLETFWSYIKDFYINYTGMFWGIVGVIVIIIFLIILRCCTCIWNRWSKIQNCFLFFWVPISYHILVSKTQQTNIIHQQVK